MQSSKRISPLIMGRSENGLVLWKNRYQHMALFGQTGTGKSSLLETMWNQENNHAKILIDPSSKLAKKAFDLKKGKALYCSVETPISLNPLQTPYPKDTQTYITAEALNQSIMMTTEGARMSPNQRLVWKELMDLGPSNLADCLNSLGEIDAPKATKNAVRVRLEFLLTDKMLPILCGPNPISIEDLINKGQTLILDCYGMTREEMVFTGNLVMQLVEASFRYADRYKKKRPLVIYMDEAQLFMSPNMVEIFLEGRKHKVCLIAATIGFADIPTDMKKRLTNLPNIATYRVGHEEATSLAKEMRLRTDELQLLDKFHFAAKFGKSVHIVKAMYPPFAKSYSVRPKRKSKGWFPAESYQPC